MNFKRSPFAIQDKNSKDIAYMPIELKKKLEEENIILWIKWK